MDSGAEKCVLIIDEQLPAGLAVNTGVVLAFTLGSRLAALIGPDVLDGSGQIHPGITTLPFPILKARADQIKAIRLRAGEMESLLWWTLPMPRRRAKSIRTIRQSLRRCQQGNSSI